MTTPRPIRLLFVCMGNICRSPAGECLFRAHVERQGTVDRFEIDSAGTTGYHVGEPPDRRMAAAARSRGYNLSGAARQVSARDLDHYDLILAMDDANLRDMRRLDRDGSRAHKIKLMLDFHPTRAGADVPDPYYGGDAGFQEVIDLIEASCPALHDFALRELPT